MADQSIYLGVNYNNLRKALFLIFFGVRNGECNDFTSPKYKYIIPMQGNFENPLNTGDKDTYIMYWIERDESLTQDDYVKIEGEGYNRQKCVADILLRFVGANAEDWAKSLRHLTKRSNITEIWTSVCNAEKLFYTSPIIPRRLDYSGKNDNIGFDIRFKLYYDEVIATGWQSLKGIDIKVAGNLSVDNKTEV